MCDHLHPRKSIGFINNDQERNDEDIIDEKLEMSLKRASTLSFLEVRISFLFQANIIKC